MWIVHPHPFESVDYLILFVSVDYLISLVVLIIFIVFVCEEIQKSMRKEDFPKNPNENLEHMTKREFGAYDQTRIWSIRQDHNNLNSHTVLKILIIDMSSNILRQYEIIKFCYEGLLLENPRRLHIKDLKHNIYLSDTASQNFPAGYISCLSLSRGSTRRKYITSFYK